MVETTAQSLPAISQMLQLITSMIPPLIRMSIGFVRVTSGIFLLLGAIGDLIGWFNISSEIMGIIIGLTLSLLTATLLLHGAYKTLGMGLMQHTIVRLYNWTRALIASTLATYGLSSAVITLFTLLTLGVFAIAAAGLVKLGTEAMSAKSDVDKLNSSLQDFNRLSSGMSTNIGTDVSDGPSGISGSGGGGGSGGSNFTYVDNTGNGNPYEVAAHKDWRQPRTSNDRA
jgi:hypothetical protein